MSDIFEIGKIVSVHGIRGEIKIYPYTNNLDLFSKLDYLFIGNEKYVLQHAKTHKKMIIASLEGIIDRDQSEALVNKLVSINREDATPLTEDSHYISDIIGCLVYENNILLGKIYDVIETGSNDVYVVKTKEKDLLIPALKSVVKKVDIDSKKIEVVLPEGLVDHEII